MATLDPSRAGDHRTDGPATVAYPDPFPALPPEPYPAAGAAPEDTDPPTDPEMPALSESWDAFDPFAADAYRPITPWYRKPSALAALAAIVAAVAARATTPVTSPPPPPPPAPPPPPPPAPQNRAPANPGHTYAPVYPRQNDDNRRNVTTPETRPPDISVRPTHRPAFPGQPGEQ